MLALFARGIIRARVAVVVAYAVLVPLLALYGAGVLRELQPGGFRDPDAESTRAAALARAFVAGDLVVLYTAHTGTVDDVEAYAALIPALARAEAAPGVLKVVSYYGAGVPWLVSRDRTRTVALLTLAGADVDKVATAARVEPLLAADGFDVAFTGYAPVFHGITSTVEDDLRRAELLALPLTLFLLLLLFRSVISAALPVVVGGVAIALTLAILRALHTLAPILGGDVTIFAANVATILGLGLAIDYSLFILMRFREELPLVGERRAVLRAMATAGRAVAFSGATVAVSLCGLFVFPHGVLRSVAAGGIAVTLATVVLATTLLPALLAILGKRVDALHVPFGLMLPHEITADDRDLWQRLAAAVMKRPLAVGVVVVAALLVCALPFARIAPSIADARSLPAGDPARETELVVEREFVAHMTTPHEILVTLDDARAPWTRARLRDLALYARRLSHVPHITQVYGPHSIDPANPAHAAALILDDSEAARAVRGLFLQGSGARLAALSALPVDDERALEQVDLLRRVPPPPGTHVVIGGQSAWVVDVREALRTHTPAMVAFIAVAMLLVLFLVFGSVVLPVKAVAMNVLSLTASFGAIVWVFQDGRMARLFGSESLGTTDASVPVLMFAIVFGLSMDYEVLLLSRVREEYLESGDNARAVARGLARTGRLITSAALLLVVVVLCFATSRLVLIQTLAVGIAVAVFLDAAVVRTLLVPATMHLLGDWNWWAPKWLARAWERVGGPRPE